MRKKLARVWIVLAIAAAAAFGADNSLGTWKLNVDKSQYTPVLPIRSMTMVREAAEGGVTVKMTGQMANGYEIDWSYTAKYDGTEATLTGLGLPYDTISVKQANPNTLTEERKKAGGTYQASGRTVISHGGKTMTVSFKGTGEDGKPIVASLVYDKQ